MSIENAVVNRIKVLIEQGMPLSPVGKKGYGLVDKEEQAIAGWLTSAIHAVELTVGSSLNAYTKRCISVLAKYDTSDAHRPRAEAIKSECVGAMVSILENLLADVEAGLISSLEDKVRAETFDDFLDHAEEYLKGGPKESGVIAGVVFVDTIRRIAQNNEIAVGHLETTINDLVKKGVITATKAKRAKSAAHVRTKATHAEWDEFDLRDVSDTIRFTRELITAHLDR
jgi:hypothetical protein